MCTDFTSYHVGTQAGGSRDRESILDGKNRGNEFIQCYHYSYHYSIKL